MLRTLSMVTGLVLVFSTSAPSLTWAAETTCTLEASGILPSLVVPAGASCTVFNAIVKGNITVLEGGRLDLIGGVTMTGSLVATSPELVLSVTSRAEWDPNVILGDVKISGADLVIAICGTHVGGDVLIAGMQGPSLAFGSATHAQCTARGGGNTVAGNVHIHHNSTEVFQVEDNVVRGQMRINANTASIVTGLDIQNNVVRRKLICKANDAPVLNVSGNDAEKAVGQCAP